MAFVVSRRLDIKPSEWDAAVEDASDIVIRCRRTSELPVLLFSGVGCEVNRTLWLVSYADTIEALSRAESGLAELSNLRVRLNQLWSHRLRRPVGQQLHEVIREPRLDDEQPRPLPLVIRAAAPLTACDELTQLAFETGDVVDAVTGRSPAVSVCYQRKQVELVVSVSLADVAERREVVRAMRGDPELARLCRRAVAIGAWSDVHLLRRIV